MFYPSVNPENHIIDGAASKQAAETETETKPGTDPYEPVTDGYKTDEFDAVVRAQFTGLSDRGLPELKLEITLSKLYALLDLPGEWRITWNDELGFLRETIPGYLKAHAPDEGEVIGGALYALFHPVLGKLFPD